MGGDDITEFLSTLLERIQFPYKDLDLARSYDWHMMEDLKARRDVLAEEIGGGEGVCEKGRRAHSDHADPARLEPQAAICLFQVCLCLY